MPRSRRPHMLVTVTVTDLDEPGSVMLSTLQPQVDEAVTATLTDGDNITGGTVNWQWFRGSTPINGSASSGSLGVADGRVHRP